jgi:hypothetical protein
MGIDASSDALTGVSGGSDLNGYSFQPGAQPWRRRRQGLNQGRLGPRTDEALKIISLRLPEFLGGNPITSPELLGSRPGGAAPGGVVLDPTGTQAYRRSHVNGRICRMRDRPCRQRPVVCCAVMDDSNDDRLTRIERLLEELRTQNSELHRLALLAGESKAAPLKPVKRRIGKKR